jgi:hypothetical protein
VQRYGQAGLGWLGLTGLMSSSPDSLTGYSKSTTLAGSSSSSADRLIVGIPDSQQQLLQLQVLSGVSPRVRAGSLAWHRVLLLDVARRLVVGCEEGSWATALPAATSLVMVSGAMA